MKEREQTDTRRSKEVREEGKIVRTNKASIQK